MLDGFGCRISNYLAFYSIDDDLIAIGNKAFNVFDAGNNG